MLLCPVDEVISINNRSTRNILDYFQILHKSGVGVQRPPEVPRKASPTSVTEGLDYKGCTKKDIP